MTSPALWQLTLSREQVAATHVKMMEQGEQLEEVVAIANSSTDQLKQVSTQCQRAELLARFLCFAEPKAPEWSLSGVANLTCSAFPIELRRNQALEDLASERKLLAQVVQESNAMHEELHELMSRAAEVFARPAHRVEDRDHSLVALDVASVLLGAHLNLYGNVHSQQHALNRPTAHLVPDGLQHLAQIGGCQSFAGPPRT